MASVVFQGASALALDAKGRLSVPARHRDVLLATANGQLVAISASGDLAWSAPLEHGDLAGSPLATNGNFLLAYRNGQIERRDAATGKSLAQRDLEQPLAAGPVPFVGRIVLAAHDGTLLVVDRP